MSVYKQKSSNNWSYKFQWNSRTIRKSTKQSNKRVAEQMEAAHRTALAKGEVGIREAKPVPTLREFAENDFLPFVRSTCADKPNTVRFYRNSVRNLNSFRKLSTLAIDCITADVIASYVAHRRLQVQPNKNNKPLETSTINRDLATLRRIFHLAQEWGKVSTVLPRVRMLGGENQRERVLSASEEVAYVQAATALGHTLQEKYETALKGIRAIQREQTPIKPDAFVLRDVVCILLDCGLRPEECFRLRPENVRDGAIWIYRGKRQASRRRVLMTERLKAIIDMRLSKVEGDGAWLFPARTKSGHIEASSIRKQHAKALKDSGVAAFELYSLRHTCLTRWAKWMDPFTLHRVAGHTDMKTTLRYVHPSDADMDEAVQKARHAQGGHSSGHAVSEHIEEDAAAEDVIN